jgi:hypothetical protein
MRRILVVDDDLHMRLDQGLSEAEPHRRHAATLAAVTTAPSEQQDAATSRVFQRRGPYGLICQKGVTQGCVAFAGIMPAAAVGPLGQTRNKAGRFALTEERWRD